MNTLKNMLVLILIAAVVSLGATGCSKKSKSTPEEQPSQGASSSEETPSEEHPAAEHPAGEHPSGEHPQ